MVSAVPWFLSAMMALWMMHSSLLFADGALPFDPAAVATQTPDETITLKLGQVQTIAVREIEKVAIGNPDMLDFTVVSPTEILLQGKTIGSTNLILWEQGGQRTLRVEVVDPVTEAIEPQMRQLITELNLPDVYVKREHDKLFLVGQVSRPEDMERLEQLIGSYKNQVTNLVSLTATAPAPGAAMPRLVKLSVEVIEVNRMDLEKLGVKWSEGMKVTQTIKGSSDTTSTTSAGTKTLKELFRWGTALEGQDISATINALVRKNRARVLAEPKLVTASGKKASSLIGLEVPILSGTSVDTLANTISTNVEYRKTGVLLQMTPTVHGGLQNRAITTVIEAEISGIDNASALEVPVGTRSIKVPGFKVRRVNTELSANSGETIVIAGLLEAEDAALIDQVPALGSVPIIGRLFRSPENSSTQREVLIAVTPELLPGDDEMTPDRLMAIEQALTAGQPQKVVNTPAHQYALQVQDRLAKGIRYPEREEALGTSGRVMLRLHVLRDGSLEKAMVAESSGNRAFDKAALDAAQGQAPYMPFPPQVTKPDLWVDIPVLFNPLALEQALTMALSKGKVGTPNDAVARRYAMQVQERLAKGIRYPDREKFTKATGQVRLRLHLKRTGELDRVEVAESSGYPSMDQEALSAAKSQAPYPPFPNEIFQQDLWLDLPVLFKP